VDSSTAALGHGLPLRLRWQHVRPVYLRLLTTYRDVPFSSLGPVTDQQVSKLV